MKLRLMLSVGVTFLLEVAFVTAREVVRDVGNSVDEEGSDFVELLRLLA